MTSSPLVSVIIPCYNAANWIGQAIDSVLNQTWQNIEIIVVDDGSTDDSLSVLDKYVGKNIEVITQENRGASSARNQGLNRAKGDYIQYLDADDLISVNKIKSQVKRLENQADSISSCQWGRFFDDSNKAKFLRQEIWKDLYPREWFITAWSNMEMMQPGVWLTPRTIVDKVGQWDESLSLDDDGEYFTRVICAARKVLFVDEAKVYYRSGSPSSLSSAKKMNDCLSRLEVARRSIKKVIETFADDEIEKACADRMQLAAYDLAMYSYRLSGEALTEADKLGGSNLGLPGGPKFKIAAKFLGWRLAKRFQGLSGTLSIR